MNKTHHELPIRVYYEDTDAGGIVYHARYLGFAERGRTEMLREAGFEHAALFREEGLAFAVVAINIDYKAPARLDDLLVVKSRISKVGGASMEIKQDIYKESKLITGMAVTLVCIDKNLKAVRLPEQARKIFKDGF